MPEDKTLKIVSPNNLSAIRPAYSNSFHVSVNGPDLSVVFMRVPILNQRELDARAGGEVEGIPEAVVTMGVAQARDLARAILLGTGGIDP